MCQVGRLLNANLMRFACDGRALSEAAKRTRTNCKVVGKGQKTLTGSVAVPGQSGQPQKALERRGHRTHTHIHELRLTCKGLLPPSRESRNRTRDRQIKAHRSSFSISSSPSTAIVCAVC